MNKTSQELKEVPRKLGPLHYIRGTTNWGTDYTIPTFRNLFPQRERERETVCVHEVDIWDRFSNMIVDQIYALEGPHFTLDTFFFLDAGSYSG